MSKQNISRLTCVVSPYYDINDFDTVENNKSFIGNSLIVLIDHSMVSFYMRKQQYGS